MKRVVLVFLFVFGVLNLKDVLAEEFLPPVVDLVLQDEGAQEPLTDKSNIQCNLTRVSLSHDVGATIASGEEYSATFRFEILQRPLDVRVQVQAALLNTDSPVQSSGIILGPSSGEVVAEFDDGQENMVAQVTLSNTGIGSGSYDTLMANCLFYTIYDEEDVLNNPGGPDLGSLVQFTNSNSTSSNIEEVVDWTIE